MRRVRLIGIVLLAVLVLAGCGSLTPVTEQGRDIQGLYNILFVAAGEIVPAVAVKTWDEYVREKFFVPLGMTRTTTSYKQLLATPNIATPHNEFEGKIRIREVLTIVGNFNHEFTIGRSWSRFCTQYKGLLNNNTNKMESTNFYIKN